ncbi:hypothetical protein TNCV_3633131 [Trichonephila clavipes]|nr:hypothetical protein TNCV_3633131 [Trichonephila clavipes]
MKKESKRTKAKQKILGVEVQPSVTPKPSRESDITSSTDVIIDPAGNLKSFAPMRLMKDPLRNDAQLSNGGGKWSTDVTTHAQSFVSLVLPDRPF